jgi:hypothetical protein
MRNLRQQAMRLETRSLAAEVRCLECGTFEIGTALLEQLPFLWGWESLRRKLSRALRSRSQGEQSPLLLLREGDLLKCIWEYEAYLAEGPQRG